MAAALSSGPALPALHAVASVTLAALMGGFNTQTFLDLSSRCGMPQVPAANHWTCTPDWLLTLQQECVLCSRSVCKSCHVAA